MTITREQKTLIIQGAMDTLRSRPWIFEGEDVYSKSYTKAFYIIDLWLNAPLKDFSIRKARGSFYNPNKNPNLYILQNKEGFNVKIAFDSLTFAIQEIFTDKIQ